MDVISRRISLTGWGGLHGLDKGTTSRMRQAGKLQPELQVEQLPNGRYYVVVTPENGTDAMPVGRSMLLCLR